MSDELTHVDERGRLRMVDVSAKPVVKRTAVAEALLRARPETIERVLSGRLPKGEAVAAARLAGIMAAKRCDEIIPLCHGLPLDAVEVDVEAAGADRIRITARAITAARTGVEMEALLAASTAALTLWDMTKAVDDDLEVVSVRLLEKRKEPIAPAAD